MSSMDPDPAAGVREALDASERVDARLIDVEVDGDLVVLRGLVASAEEADVAVLLAEQRAGAVVNQLRVDPAVREQPTEPAAGEPAVAAEDEVLVGDVDMLAGPEADITDDLDLALQENQPWDPPEEPIVPPVRAERAGGTPSQGGDRSEDPDADELPGLHDERPAAADLSAEELRVAAEGHPLPALDPDRVAADEEPDARDADMAAAAGPSPLAGTGGVGEGMVSQVPGTRQGPGAVGEPTTAGGALGGTPAVETGARGADTAAADPARRATGGVMDGPGSARGPVPVPEDDPAERQEPSGEQ
jgi:hypothetical protein